MDSGRAMAVLVVDESDVFLASALNWIDSRSDLCFAGVARNGPEAREAVDRLSPDVVIVECVMHGADGFRLARELKARENPPFVLLVTFHANAAARDEALASGADAFLAKYDLFDGFDAVIGDWRRATPTPRATPGRPGSRTAPDP